MLVDEDSIDAPASSSVTEDKSLSLQVPDEFVRRHSFHDVLKGSEANKFQEIGMPRRNSSYSASQLDRLITNDFGDGPSPTRSKKGSRRHSHAHSHSRRRHSRQHHKHHSHLQPRRQSRGDFHKSTHHRRHSHRRSSVKLDIYPQEEASLCLESKVELTDEQKTKQKVMMAVLVVTGFIVVVSVILVAVTLQLSPTIDELVRKENANLWNKMPIHSNEEGTTNSYEQPSSTDLPT